MQGILSHRNIHIKVFGETPMADVEMIFPEKHVRIKPFQLVNLMVTVITALITGLLVLLKAGSNINMNILWTAASLVLTRCFTVYNTAQTQRTLLQQQMTSALYDKMQDSQEGVVSVIVEEMADQQLKQMLVAYMLLIIKDRPLTHQDLDVACEEFLYKDFDHAIDYELASALPRLKSWRLVHENAQGKLQALPMREAIALLESAWSTAYKFVGQGSHEVLTIDMITGAHSVFAEGIRHHLIRQQAAATGAESDSHLGGKLVGKGAHSVSAGVSAVTHGIGSGLGKAKDLVKMPFGKNHAGSGTDQEQSSLKQSPSKESLMEKGSLTGKDSTHSSTAAVPATASVTEPPKYPVLEPGTASSEAIGGSSHSSIGGGPPEKPHRKRSSLKNMFKKLGHHEH
eukprot:GHRR01009757.1.p1 GENE.GHRR01009757.1~~GHRR01009757.1.p1  ORF type:complete len:399 (+),score=148.54 GHRR01009757.1:1103-2299(+)